MSEPTGVPFPDWTPEQKKAIYAEMKAKFTVEDLLEYINDDGTDRVPAEQVLEEMRAIVAEVKARKKKGAGG